MWFNANDCGEKLFHNGRNGNPVLAAAIEQVRKLGYLDRTLLTFRQYAAHVPIHASLCKPFTLFLSMWHLHKLHPPIHNNDDGIIF